MSSTPANPNAQPQNPQGGYAPPAGAPPTGAPAGQGAPPNPATPGAPAAGQQPYPYPPPGAYAPPPPGQPGYYPPAPGQYYAAPGQYPYAPYAVHPGYYPPLGQYAPPPGQYSSPPGQYPPPPGQYPPPSGQYAPPPAGAPGTPGAPGAPAAPGPGQYAPPAGAPPPPAAPYPPAGQAPYGSPYQMPGFPPGAIAPVGPQPGFYAPPTPQHASQDPLFYLGTAIPDPGAPAAAHGAQKVPGYDPAHDYNEIVRATAIAPADQNKRQSPLSSSYMSLSTRAANVLTLETKSTAAVMKVLLNLNVLQMDALNDYFTAKQGVSLTDRIEKATTGNFGIALRELTLGPLGCDVDLARKALVGLGTNEMLLTELILGRPGHEIRWLKTAYRLRYGKDLVDAVKSDLSGKTERMFTMALNTQKPVDSPYVGVDHTRVNADVETLHNAAKKRDEIPFFEILINRSDAHLAAVISAYSTRYKSLSKIIKKTFSGTTEEALLYIVHGVKPKRDQQGYWRDAKLLEKSMAGLGTKDTQLIYRLVRAHWNPQRLEAIKDAYKRRYGKPLENRVKGETSGPYRDLLIAVVKSSEAGAAPK